MKRIIGILILFVFFVISCRDPDILPGYRFMEEPQRYIIFPEGSKWVYEDTATQALDTVEAVFTGYGTLTKESPVSGVTIQWVYCNYSFDTLIAHFSFFKGITNDEYVEHYIPLYGGGIKKTSLRFIKGAQMRKINEGDFGYLSFAFHDSLVVSGSTYYNVIHSSFDPSVGLDYPGQRYYFKETYFAEDIGIVKYVKSDSTVHLLKEYLIQP